ncbi:hypothetical protein [Psychromonas sp.]|uniref:hypothetical protein n=1 Tax=Psychromonas sp. TaxID=1884585 RepID=UPI0035683CFA
MKKALKITNDTYLNMQSIIMYHFEIDRVILRTPLDSESNGILIAAEKRMFDSGYTKEFVVSIEEVKRIQREICKYMGIE